MDAQEIRLDCLKMAMEPRSVSDSIRVTDPILFAETMTKFVTTGRIKDAPAKSPFTVTQIAEVCHEANLGLCETTGDFSQKPWILAEQWQRDSAIKGVEFALANPDAPPSAQHDAWSEDKKKDGWVYGEVKDAEAKTHPCLVPYDQLPIEQRAKDVLFKAVVKALSEMEA